MAKKYMKRCSTSRIFRKMQIKTTISITTRLPEWLSLKTQLITNGKDVDSEKAGLKLNIHKIKNMASGPITSWEIDGETVETVSDFIFLGFKITADGDFSHEIKRCLLLGRKVMTNIDSILKSKDITLSTKVCLVKSCMDVRVGL